MDENVSRFQLAKSSPLFKMQYFKKIGSYRLNQEVPNLLWNNVDLCFKDTELNSFMNLLYQSTPITILSKIST